MPRRTQPSRATIRQRMQAHARVAFHPPPEPPPPPKDALLLGRHPVTKQIVYILPSELDTHLQFVGGSRRGKTNALRRLFVALLKRRKTHGEGISIIDPHGGLAQYAIEACAKDPDLAPHVLYMTLKDVQNVLSINPLMAGGGDPYFQAACVREGLIKAFDQTRSQDKPLVNRVLLNLAQALIELKLTLVESRHFLDEGDPVLVSSVQKLPEGDLRSYWQKFLRLSSRDAEMHAMGPANRLDDLIRPPVLRRMLGQTGVSVNFLELMNRGGIAIFDTSIGQDTEITADGQALFNALLVQQYRQAFPRRTEKGARGYDPQRTPPHTLIMDEFGSYMSMEFARTLTESSKFGLRCVFSHQNLAQLIPGDKDQQLLNAVLAIPNKVVFGNLPFEEAKQLATHIYLADLNPDEIKYQGETVTWDPVLKWGVTAVTNGRTVTHEPTRRTTSRDSGTRTRSSGITTDPDTGRQILQEGTAEQDPRVSESASSADGPIIAGSRSVTQGYYTDHVMRKQKQPPIYRTVDEQVFKAAQAMSTNERGVAVIGTEGRKPTLCRFPNLDERPVGEEERTKFLTKVYRKPVYLPTKEAEKLIADRQRRLLDEAEPAIRSSSGPSKRRAPVRVSRPSAGRPPEPRAAEGVGPEHQVSGLVEEYERLGLPNGARLRTYLDRAQRFYTTGDYKESVFNSRNILEGVLSDIAENHARGAGRQLRAADGFKIVRDYLETSGLLDQSASRMLRHAYGMQSDLVHHEGEPTREQALFWLNQAKTLAHFVLQRFAGKRSG